MAMTYQIAAIGDWESVMGFRALGLEWLWRTVREPRRIRTVANMFAALPRLTRLSLRQSASDRKLHRQNARKSQKIVSKSMQSDNLVKK